MSNREQKGETEMVLELIDLLIANSLAYGLAVCVLSLAIGVIIGRATKNHSKSWMDDPDWTKDPDKVRYIQTRLRKAGVIWRGGKIS